MGARSKMSPILIAGLEALVEEVSNLRNALYFPAITPLRSNVATEAFSGPLV